MTNEKPAANYRYVGHTDAPFDVFRGEEKITEEEWRREAPADEVAALDAEPGTRLRWNRQTTSPARWRSKSLVTLPNASMRRPRPSSRNPFPLTEENAAAKLLVCRTHRCPVRFLPRRGKDHRRGVAARGAGRRGGCA